MKKITTFGIALGIAVVSAGAATAQVKFGVGGPITGPSAATGAQMKNGVDQAAADINAAGGILGQKISVSYGDDVSDPKQGVSVANKFSADGVKFVIGHYNSGVTIPSSEVYQENGVLQITPASTNPTVTERKMWNIFRVCGRDDQQGQVAGEYIAKHFKGKKIAVVHVFLGTALASPLEFGFRLFLIIVGCALAAAVIRLIAGRKFIEAQRGAIDGLSVIAMSMFAVAAMGTTGYRV